MNKAYTVGQKIVLARMHGMKNAPATVQDVYEDHLVVRTHTGQFVKIKDRDIVGNRLV